MTRSARHPALGSRAKECKSAEELWRGVLLGSTASAIIARQQHITELDRLDNSEGGCRFLSQNNLTAQYVGNRIL